MILFDPHSLSLMLAQDGAAPPTQGGTVATPGGAPATTADGTALPTPGSGGRPLGGGGDFIWIILVVFVVIIVMSILGQRRDRKRREAMISAVKKHDRVQTIGGVIGSVIDVKPNTVVLKVDESANTRITFARSAIQQVLEPSTESGESSG